MTNLLVTVDKVIYVDEAIFPYRQQLWCHMWCADVETLHQFAARIGLKRSWFQARNNFPHYDLSPSRRATAIQKGATAVSCEELLKLTWLQRFPGQSPPREANLLDN